ncbi:MAG: 16S rRNA (guanine(527)-N(7))-methyltransferase RsmG [Lachnospiraceae bacterium]|nr:16S rRNA (guanine(527)-N(7))-methyltransferase RsmG [Lachnospiraceae bacterium]
MGISLEQNQIGQFIKYYELLIEWNQFMNLTAITEFDEVCTKHFIDSLSLCKAIDCTKEYTLIDVGTGAGFPGIPLKIAFPNLKITLLDSLGKRVKFLNEVIGSLGMKNIEAIHGRAEDYAKPDLLREQFDLCVSRAVANLSTLSEYCLPYVKVDGFFISYKSEKISEEMQMAKKAIEILGGEVYNQKEFTLPNSDIYRNLCIIKKVHSTSKKFPRKAGLPSKEPL